MPEALVFIDSRVPDLQVLLDGMKPGEAVVVLDASRDGVQQIADYLTDNELTDVSSISIVGHGTSGAIDLGSVELDDSDFGTHAGALSTIGASLAAGGDLLLYGCDVASGASGAQFIADLAQFTGADVAAATHVVGAADLGGSWTLDASIGSIEASAPFSDQAMSDFDGTLALPTSTWTESGLSAIHLHTGASSSGNDSVGYTIAADQQGDYVFGVGELSNGSRFVVYDGNLTFNNGAPLNSVNVSIVDSGGAVTTHAIDFTGGNSPLGASDYDIEATALTDGGFVVVANQYNDGTGNGNIYYEVFDNSGAVTKSWTRLNTSNGDAALNATHKVVAAADGGFVVAWHENNEQDGYYQRFNGDGTSAGAAVHIAHQASGSYWAGALAIDGNDNVMVGIDDHGDVRSSQSYAIYNSGGTEITGGTYASAESAYSSVFAHGAEVNLNHQSFTGLSAGGFLVTDFAPTTDYPYSAFSMYVQKVAVGANSATWGTPGFIETVSGNPDLIVPRELSDGNVMLAVYTSGLESWGAPVFKEIDPDNLPSNSSTPVTFFSPQGSISPAGTTITSWMPDGKGGVVAAIFNSASGLDFHDSGYVVDSNLYLANFDTPNPPIVTADGVAATFHRQPVAVDPGITVVDADSATLAAATVSIGGGFHSGEDVLAFSNTSSALFGNITGVYNSGELDLSSTGATATVAQWQNALAAVTYTDTAGAGATPGDRTVSFTANDGALDSTPSSATVHVHANDAPVTGGPVSVATDEDAALVFNTADNTAIVIADTDGDVQTVTLTVGHGTLALSTTNGLTITDGADGTATITFSGTLADVNTALADLSYQAAQDYNGSDTLTVITSDGIAADVTNSVAITVNAVSDPVTVSMPAPLVIDEDHAVVLAGLTVSDVDAVLAPNGQYEASLSAGHGTFALGTMVGLTLTTGAGAGDATVTFHGTLADVNAALAAVTYTPGANYHGADTIVFSGNDEPTNINVVATGSGPESNDSANVGVTINSVNDAPVAADDVGAVVEFRNIAGDVIAGGVGGVGQDTDVDGDTLHVTAVSGAHGAGTLSMGLLGSYGTLYLGGDGRYVYVADHADPLAVGATETDTFAYTVSDNNGGTDTADLAITITGSAIGNGAANQLVGTAGNDTLNDQGGGDTMSGGDGNDFYVVYDGADVVNEADTVAGGVDRVFARVSYTLTAGQAIETLSTDNNAGTDAINLTGNEFANTIIGNEGANVLDGKGGADVLAGSGGNDTYIVDNAADRIIEAVGGGTDLVLAHVSYTLGNGVEIETLSTDNNSGTDAINLTGNEFANTIIGNDGANTLDGKGGADVLAGSGGNDFFIVDDAADQVIEAAGGGTDRVFTHVSYTLGGGQEIELFSTDRNVGTDAINLTGNELAQTIYGNAGDNVINGGGGKDTLVGGGGHDTFVFSTALNATTNVVSIVDFGPTADDLIDLNHSIFAHAGALGTLADAAFYSAAGATAAHDADDHIIYNTTTGALYYDADGQGGAAAVQFATLSGHPTGVNHSDFVIV